VIDQELSMADTGVIDLDTGVVVEKRGRVRPRSSKNKPKEASMAISSSSATVKRLPGHPLGSKNKPNPLFLLPTNLWMQSLRATMLLLFLLSTYSLSSLSLVLNAVNISVCL
jgi:hypothetical protein